jgi:serine protease Do
MPLEFRHEGKRRETLVRLMGIQPKNLGLGEEKPAPKAPPAPITPKGPPSPASKFYEPKPGFANFYYNRLERDRLLMAFKKHGDFSDLAGEWTLDARVRFKKLRDESPAFIQVSEERLIGGKRVMPVVRMKVGAFPAYVLEPLKVDQEPALLRLPETSGGFLAAVYLYKQLLTGQGKGFSEFAHGGFAPFYPPLSDDKKIANLSDRRVECEVLNTRLGPFLATWYFDRRDAKLLGYEVRLQENEDPCEVYLSDYRPVLGRMLPHRIQVIYGDGHYGTFMINNYKPGVGS